MPTFLLPALLFLAGSPAALAAPSPAAPGFAALGLPAPLSKPRLQGLLQDFVSTGYGRRFRALGDERDFDHGHILLDAATGAPVAILYHTQELAHESAEGYVDPDGRNWLQWLDGRGIENARRYERASYPRSGAWDWFVARELPKLRGRRTITDRMLDPQLVGEPLAPGRQWTFTRTQCGADADPASGVIRVVLPGGAPVCLALGAS